jgi:hypothetical protein
MSQLTDSLRAACTRTSLSRAPHLPAPANPSLTAGTIGGYWFWYQVHVPMSAY